MNQNPTGEAPTEQESQNSPQVDPKRRSKIMLLFVLTVLLVEVWIVQFRPDMVLALMRRAPSYPAGLHPAFLPGPLFSPLGEPKPGDWLAEHTEYGQNYDQFVTSSPNMPGRNGRDRIHIQPLGHWDREWREKLKPVQDITQAFYGMTVEVDRSVRDFEKLFTQRIQPGTGMPQILTTDVLKYLKKRLAPDSYSTIAVTMTDLYPDERWNFVFGQASLRDRVGVFSLIRYNPEYYKFGKKPENPEQVVLVRSTKVILHELGHMFGMHHCIYYKCLLNGSNSMDESDSQPITLCPVCLRKLHHLLKFDPMERYRKLLGLYRKYGIESGAIWIEARIKEIEAGR